MAKKMALVPESWLHRNFQDAEPKSPTLEVSEYKEENKTELEGLPELLPKCYRSKAKTILHYLRGKIVVTNNQRIQYTDRTVGSHVLTMLRYFVSPFVTERPVDAPKFEKLMKEAGVPDYIFAKKATKATINWKTYK